MAELTSCVQSSNVIIGHSTNYVIAIRASIIPGLTSAIYFAAVSYLQIPLAQFTMSVLLSNWLMIFAPQSKTVHSLNLSNRFSVIITVLLLERHRKRRKICFFIVRIDVFSFFQESNHSV